MRKALSFVLVLSLVLGSFTMAFAAPAKGLSDISDSANVDAIKVAYDLGIVTGNPDGTFLPAKAVNRAEFAAMITRALAIPDSALAGYTTTSFKDTVGYGWAVPYLAFAQSKGIMLGDGQGNAMPGRTINTNEAITMALRAIGYTANSAELVGAWPSNYVSLAQNVGLYDDVANVVSVDKANAAQIIYNLLTVQKVAVNSTGETKALWVGKESDGVEATLLNTGLGATAWASAQVINGEEDSKISLRPYVGAAVIAYEKDDEIVAIGDVKSTFLTVDKTVASNATKFKTADGTEYTLPTSVVTGYAIFLNGEETDSSTNTAITIAKGQKFAVELKGKTVDKLWSLSTWDISQGTAALFEENDFDEEDATLLGETFVTNDDDEIDYNSFELFGAASLDDIKVDDVVYVYINSSDDITKVTVGTEVVKGKITKTDADGKYYIDGKAYEYDGNGSSPSIGDTGTARLAYNGKIFDWDVDDASSGNYAMVTGDYDNPGRDYTVVLFDKEGTEKEYVVKSGITIVSDGAVSEDDLVVFALNKDGKVDKLEELTPTAVSANGKLSKSAKILDGKTIASGVVVFVKNGAADYDLGKLDSIKKDEDLSGNAWYYTDADGKVAAIIVNKAYAKESDSVYGVLNLIELAINDDDDDVNYLDGFVGGKAFKVYTDDRYFASADKVSTISALLYEFELDADGVVTSVKNLGALTSESAIVAGYMIQEKDGNLIKVNGEFVSIDSNAVVYQYDPTASNGSKYSVKSISSLKKDQVVYLYQVDEDSEVFDIVIFVK